MAQHSKRGYLLENFRLFHLKSRGGSPVEYHYHEFCKILLLVQGSGFNWPSPDHFRLVFLPHEDDLQDAFAAVTRTGTALWSAVIALFIGLFLGVGEGIYYGSGGKAVKYALIGAGVSLAIGFISE